MGHGAAPPLDRLEGRRGHLADRGRGYVVATEDCQEVVEVPRTDVEHHPFLRFRNPDLPRAQTRFPERDLGQVDLQPEPSRVGQFAERRGNPAPAQVLQAPHQPSVERLEAGMDEGFLHDRVPELDGAPRLRFAAVGDLLGSERYPADAVPSGEPADEHEPVPDRVRAVRKKARPRQEAEATDVHKRVDDVGLVEVDPPGDRGDPNPVPVVPDPGDDAVRQIPGALHARGDPALGKVERPEEQRVGERDRLGADGQDIPQDPPDAGGGAPVRLDRRRVVVGLDPEGVGVAIPELHHAGVPGAEDPRPGRRPAKARRRNGRELL